MIPVLAVFGVALLCLACYCWGGWDERRRTDRGRAAVLAEQAEQERELASLVGGLLPGQRRGEE